MILNLRPTLDRRTFLRGASALIALPLLESMIPRGRAGAMVNAAKSPVRLMFIHTESGMWMDAFKPKTFGSEFELTPTLEPLADFKSDFTVCTGLYHPAAFKRNACGRHCQDTTCFLTGADLGAVPGVPTRNTVSVDQVAVRHLGDRTRFPYLHFSPGGINSIVHSETGTPIPAETNPQDAFNRLFADNSLEARNAAKRRLALNKSVLDDVLDSARDLERHIGSQDKAKLDEYLTNVREVERRTQVSEKWLDHPAPAVPSGAKAPTNSGTRTERIRALLDVTALALQTDQTRVVTLQIGGMGCTYPEIDAPEGYHKYTHEDPKNMQKVDRHRVSHLAYFLDRIKSVKEGENNVLFNSTILYGSGMGSWHESTDLANILIGHAGGALKPGQHIDFKGKPLANLFLTMLDTAGIEEKRFADVTERLSL
jgi:hypothetical protein